MGAAISAVCSVAVTALVHAFSKPPQKPKDLTLLLLSSALPPAPPKTSEAGAAQPVSTVRKRVPQPPPPATTIKEIIRNARSKLGLDVVKHYNYALVGNTGVGKSSLINSLLLKPDNDPGAAKVGEVETTKTICKYSYPGLPHVVLWDVPGAGTLKHPEATYFEDNMLYAFDCLLILSSDRFHAIDFRIAEKAIKYKTQCAFVRTKADLSLKSLAHRMNKTMAKVAPIFKQTLTKNFNDSIKNMPTLKASRENYKLFTVCAWAFNEKRHPYRFFKDETGEIDDTLSSMDEKLLIDFVAECIRYRGAPFKPKKT